MTKVQRFILLAYLHVKRVDQTWQAKILIGKEERSVGGRLKQEGKLRPIQNANRKGFKCSDSFPFCHQLELEGHTRQI
jgi:hypothetical protein